MTLHQMATEWHQATERMKTTSAMLFAKLRHVRAKARAAKADVAQAGPPLHADPSASSAWPK
jgi:hypothetical protein